MSDNNNNNNNNTPDEPPSLVGLSTDPKESLKVYDSWASKYDADIVTWGYDMPSQVAKTLQKHVSSSSLAGNYKVLDAGAGSGLSGVALQEAGFVHVDANDLSPKMLEIAKKRNCYETIKVVDMNQSPLPYANDSFDIVVCVGTVTYLEPSVLDEFVRITRPGGYVCYTNRTDKEQVWKAAEDSQEEWDVVEISDPLPYLPNNGEFADKVLVTVRLFRVKE